MNFHDPTSKDAHFPSRPSDTPDFVRLSLAAQGMDMRAEAGASIEDIVPLDQTAVDYFIEHRLGVLGKALGMNLAASPLMRSLYLDALTAATLAEQAR